MSNPTSNYSFQMPTSTDLVTDLPADFEVFGQAVDTQMKTNADAAITKTIVDAKGDLIAATAADTVARLAVGTNGQVLTVDSAEATGMKWATAAAGGMTLISTTTLTGSSVTISSIPSTYVNLQLIITNYKPSVDGEGLRMRLNSDSGTRYKTNVDLIGNGTFADSFIALVQSADNSVAQGLVSIDFPYYANSATWKMCFVQSVGNDPTTTTSFRSEFLQGLYNQTAAISDIVLYNGSGNFTSGTAYLYGVK